MAKTSTRKYKWTERGRKQIARAFKRVETQLSEYIYYPKDSDKSIIEFSMVPAVALQWRDQPPVWAMIIGAPGSGKTLHTELLRDWEQSYFVSSITDKSLISGYKDPDDPEADYSILPQLDGKLFVVKDFTSMMKGRRDQLEAVMGQLRDVYDGDMANCYGNTGRKEFEARFNILLAVTPVIDAFHSVNQQLGERFIARREFCTDRMGVLNLIINGMISQGSDDRKRNGKLSYVEFLQRLPEVPLHDFKWTPELLSKIALGADLIARGRSHVTRGYGGAEISAVSDAEVASRLVQVIMQCVAAYSLIHGKEGPDEDAWQFGVRILRDTLTQTASTTLYAIYELDKELNDSDQETSFHIGEVCNRTHIGRRTTQHLLDDLVSHRLMNIQKEQHGGVTYTKYSLAPSTRNIIETLGFFKGYEPRYTERT